MKRVMFLASTRAYQTDDFVAAAHRLGIELALATDRCHVLAETWPQGALSVDFRDPDRAAAAIAESARHRPLHGIVPTDEITAVIAARAATLLDLPGSPVEAAVRSGNKLQFRHQIRAAGLPHPSFCALLRTTHPARVAEELAQQGMAYPVVVKPLHLSASRGVMRADDPDTLADRWIRISALLGDPEVAAIDDEAARMVLVESYIPGREVAFEGILEAGELHELVIFDKPDPLDGPFFAETIYVAPHVTRGDEPRCGKPAITAAVAAVARAIGLKNGPLHAELRLAENGPVVLELAARSIGGLCNRTLRFATGIALEELILDHAVGHDVAQKAALVRSRLGSGQAAGVLMLPVPKHGVLREIRGIESVRSLPGVCDIAITARPGDLVVPLPEGHTYMGFVFARGDDSAGVTEVLRRADEQITFDIAPTL
ncbi:MAG: ATP-grasp domain-containing protein [Proteobacteria bacterium]|nr:ATP-grasp domain-containing protein [Pseudomonadota bacterium]